MSVRGSYGVCGRRALRCVSLRVCTVLFLLPARHTAFFSASILAVYIALTIADEDFLAVEHVIQTMTVLGVLVAVCRAAIPDEVRHRARLASLRSLRRRGRAPKHADPAKLNLSLSQSLCCVTMRGRRNSWIPFTSLCAVFV